MQVFDILDADERAKLQRFVAQLAAVQGQQPHYNEVYCITSAYHYECKHVALMVWA